MSKLLYAPFVVLLCLGVYGCAAGAANAVHTISSGSRIPLTDEQWEKIQRGEWPRLRVVVWGNHHGAAQAAIWEHQMNGDTVVERARLVEIFEEQRIQLTHSTDDDARILKVGKLIGADRVVFVETSDRSEVVSGAFVGPYGGGSSSRTAHHVSVSVRSVDVETGEVKWSGHSTFNQPISDPEVAIPMLTRLAVARATCPLDRGVEWTEAGLGPSEKVGCRKRIE